MTTLAIDETHSAATRETAELFDRLLEDAGSVRAVVLVGLDGLPLLWTGSLPEESADQFATIVLGLQSLAGAAAQLFACDRAGRLFIELSAEFLLVDRIGSVALLGVVVDKAGDIGAATYEATLLAERRESRLDDDVVAELCTRVDG